MERKSALSDSQLATLQVLNAASVSHDVLALYHAYKEVLPSDYHFLVDNGFWFVASATQGHITELGVWEIRFAENAKAIEEKANKSPLNLSNEKLAYLHKAAVSGVEAANFLGDETDCEAASRVSMEYRREIQRRVSALTGDQYGLDVLNAALRGMTVAEIQADRIFSCNAFAMSSKR